MPIIATFILLSSLGLSAALGQQKTANYKEPGGFEQVTYDPSRINRSELDRVMEISPRLSQFNFMAVPEEVELCKSFDPRYRGCGTKNHFNAHNANLNLASISDRIKRLDPEKYPFELKPVVEYLGKLQTLWLWKEQQKLDFYRTNDLSVLETRNGSIDPKATCEETISKIRSSTDRAVRFQLVAHQWANCVWGAITAELGPYPIDQWNLYISSHGIAEREISTEED